MSNDNVLDFPTKNNKVNNSVVDFGDVSLDDMEKAFKAVDLLVGNAKELTDKFKPDVEKFLERKNEFEGQYKKAFEVAFKDFVRALIKKEIVDHFTDFTPEDIEIIASPVFIDIVTEGYYYDLSNYGITKEGNNNENTNPIQ